MIGIVYIIIGIYTLFMHGKIWFMQFTVFRSNINILNTVFKILENLKHIVTNQITK